MRNMKRNGGFTLMEIAIVISIIALIAGGITIQQSMVKASRLQAVVSEVTKYKQAIDNFRDKYQALPGDFAGATALWGAAHATPATCYTTIGTGTQTCDGNGDGRITTQATDTTATQYEQFRAWQHLANANLIDGLYTGKAGTLNPQDTTIGTNAPASQFKGAGYGLISLLSSAAEAGNAEYTTHYYTGINYMHMLQFGSDLGSVSYSGLYYSNLIGPILTPSDALTLDKKMDDGAPGTGMVIAEQMNSLYSPNCTTSNTASTAAYDLTQASTTCSLSFLLGF